MGKKKKNDYASRKKSMSKKLMFILLAKKNICHYNFIS